MLQHAAYRGDGNNHRPPTTIMSDTLARRIRRTSGTLRRETFFLNKINRACCHTASAAPRRVCRVNYTAQTASPTPCQTGNALYKLREVNGPCVVCESEYAAVAISRQILDRTRHNTVAWCKTWLDINLGLTHKPWLDDGYAKLGSTRKRCWLGGSPSLTQTFTRVCVARRLEVYLFWKVNSSRGHRQVRSVCGNDATKCSCTG